MRLSNKEIDELVQIAISWEEAEDDHRANFDNSTWTFGITDLVAKQLGIEEGSEAYDDLFDQLQEAGIFNDSQADIPELLKDFQYQGAH